LNRNVPSLTLKAGSLYIYYIIKVDRKGITLANINAPYEDNPQLFEVILNHLEVFKSEKNITGGNFNHEMKV